MRLGIKTSFPSLVVTAVATVLVGAAFAAAPSGSDAPPVPHARAKLVADTSAIVPGQSFTLAIVFDIDPDWHLYYKNPGESGMPPSVKWNLPVGLTAGELQFPKPEILKTPAGTNFVHSKELALLVKVTAASDFKSDSPVKLSGDLRWLECNEDRCEVKRSSVSIELPAGSTAEPANREEFDAWRTKVDEAASFDAEHAK